MFISKKRWNALEDRVSALEQQAKPISLDQMKESLKIALESSFHRSQQRPVPSIFPE